MPELPEVEITRAGIVDHIINHEITKVIVRNPKLRLPVPISLANDLSGQRFNKVARRAKYLLLYTNNGTLILHLGMSGSLRILNESINSGPHDHCDLIFKNGTILRFNDPRRFGLITWTHDDPLDHPLLCNLGLEPLALNCNGDYFYQRSRNRNLAVKSFIMDQRIVVGVGNIYAAESLFLAGIHPLRAAGSIDQNSYSQLANAVRTILTNAIMQGGTTLRNFHDAAGQPGDFKSFLKVYGRTGQPCVQCHHPILVTRSGQRSTFYCNHCQH